MNNMGFFCNNWHLVMPSKALAKGKMVAKILMGRAILLGKSEQGHPFAMFDSCPHRGAPLTQGHFDGCQIECCLHGWRFDTQGCCTYIPVLSSQQNETLTHFKILTFPCREIQGNIWIYFGENEQSELSIIPRVPNYDDYREHQLAYSQTLACDFDQAIVKYNSLDKSLFLSNLPTIFFNPESKKYRIVNEIDAKAIFQTSCVTITHIQVGKREIYALITMTPIEQNQTEINHFFYWDSKLLTLIKPVVHSLITKFLEQDYQAIQGASL